MIGFERIETREEMHAVRQLIMDHYYYTQSTKAMEILDNWAVAAKSFIKVVPNDYKLMLEKIASYKESGLTDEEAAMQAFLLTSTKQEKKQELIGKK